MKELRKILEFQAEKISRWERSMSLESFVYQIDRIKSSRMNVWSKLLEIHKVLFISTKYDKPPANSYDTSPYLWILPGNFQSRDLSANSYPLYIFMSQ